VKLPAHRENPPDQPDEQVPLGLDGLDGERHLDAGDDEKQSEEPHHPVELHQRGAQGDEDGPEDQGAQDAVEEDPMLVARGNAEVPQHEDEDEDVVEGQRILDQVAGEKLQGHLPGRRLGIESGHRGEARVEGKFPPRVDVEKGVEEQGQAHPDPAPAQGFPDAHLARVAMKDAEIEGQEEQHAPGEGAVEPPVLRHGKERRPALLRCCDKTHVALR